MYPLVSLMVLITIGCGDEGSVLTPTDSLPKIAAAPQKTKKQKDKTKITIRLESAGPPAPIDCPADGVVCEYMEGTVRVKVLSADGDGTLEQVAGTIRIRPSTSAVPTYDVFVSVESDDRTLRADFVGSHILSSGENPFEPKSPPVRVKGTLTISPWDHFSQTSRAQVRVAGRNDVWVEIYD
jgi:hypothetical protein